MSEQINALKIQWKTRDLKNLIDAVGVTNNKTMNIRFKPDGVNVYSLADGSVCMVDAKFPKTDFQEYSAPELDLAVDLKEIGAIMKRFDDKKLESVTISKTGDSRIVIEGGGKKFMNRLIEGNFNFREMPKIDTTIEIETSFSELKELLDDAQIGEDGGYDKVRTKFTVKDGKLTVYRFTTKTEFERTIHTGGEWKIEGDGEGYFDIRLVRTIALCAKKAEKVNLKFGGMKPMIISFDAGNIVAYLAPMVQEE